MQTYNRKPYTIQAVRYAGDAEQRGFLSELIPGVVASKAAAYVPTPRGTKIASVGDYVVQVPDGGFDVYSAQEFDKKFEEMS